jgi:hypothetical protein
MVRVAMNLNIKSVCSNETGLWNIVKKLKVLADTVREKKQPRW